MAASLADHGWAMREWITMPSVQCVQDTTDARMLKKNINLNRLPFFGL
jgi:hypothetical protein